MSDKPPTKPPNDGTHPPKKPATKSPEESIILAEYRAVPGDSQSPAPRVVHNVPWAGPARPQSSLRPEASSFTPSSARPPEQPQFLNPHFPNADALAPGITKVRERKPRRDAVFRETSGAPGQASHNSINVPNQQNFNPGLTGLTPSQLLSRPGPSLQRNLDTYGDFPASTMASQPPLSGFLPLPRKTDPFSSNRGASSSSTIPPYRGPRPTANRPPNQTPTPVPVRPTPVQPPPAPLKQPCYQCQLSNSTCIFGVEEDQVTILNEACETCKDLGRSRAQCQQHSGEIGWNPIGPDVDREMAQRQGVFS